MRTLLLDTDTWDLCLDGAGQIAIAGREYSIAQNVANAIRLFTEDAWFDPDRGIPHFDLDLGKKTSLAVIRSRYREAALAVEGVLEADVQIYGITERTLEGNIHLTLTNGAEADVAL